MDSIVDCKGYISRARWLRQGANSHEHKPGGKQVIRALNEIAMHCWSSCQNFVRSPPCRLLTVVKRIAVT